MIINTVINRSIYNIFLIDGLGALITTCLLFFVLIPSAESFGLPEEVFKPMLIAGMVFTVYSTTLYLWKPTMWRTLLKGIALANTSYCVYLVYRLIEHNDQVTALGWVYFIGELLVIMALSRWEWFLSASK